MDGDSGPGTVAWLPNLTACSCIREGPGLGLAAHPPWLMSCVPDPTLARRPWGGGLYLLGSQLGTAAATSGRGDCVCVCVCVCVCRGGRVREGAHLLLSGRPPNGPTVFSGFPHGAWGTLSSRGRAVGSRAKPFLEWNSQRSWSGAWHRNPTCFVSGISW